MPRWNPSDYASHSSAQLSWARELIEKLALRGDERVLDIGCGDGRVTAEIARRLTKGRAVGVDNSAEMIRHARESFPEKNHRKLSFIRMDARELAFEGEFDVVFSNACLHWITDHRPVIRGIARSLFPGGRILLQMGGKGNAAGILAVLDDMLSEPEWRGWFEGFTFPYGFHGSEEYAEWLAVAGFTDIDTRLVPKDMIHGDASGLEGWVRTTWLPYTECVPEKKREAFIREIVARYLARRPPDAAGKTHVSMVRLEAGARKPA